jgi:WhiB family redox-sensing transcriptional regulator
MSHMGTCADCGRENCEIVSRGLDASCYARNARNGTLRDFPSLRRHEHIPEPVPAPDNGPEIPVYADRDPDWRRRAACRSEDPELFFPISETTAPGLAQIEQASAVCRRCPVAEPCLDWALETGQAAGVWAATTTEERRLMKRRTARRNRATTPSQPTTEGATE